jgi:hypothetical protein
MVSSQSVCETTQGRYLENGATCCYDIRLVYVRAIYTTREAVSQSIQAFFNYYMKRYGGWRPADWSSAVRVHADAAQNIRLNQLPPGTCLQMLNLLMDVNSCPNIYPERWLTNLWLALKPPSCVPPLYCRVNPFKGKWKRGILVILLCEVQTSLIIVPLPHIFYIIIDVTIGQRSQRKIKGKT